MFVLLFQIWLLLMKPGGIFITVFGTGGGLAQLGRQERNITPVDLAANEIYDILRKLAQLTYCWTGKKSKM